MLVAWLVACAPAVFRYPGPLRDMGTEPEPRETVAPAPLGTASGRAVARTAADLVGARAIRVGGVTYRLDCSGLVEAALAGGGCPFAGSSAMLHAKARELGVLHRRRLPSPGDVAFFDDTYDRDGNGRLDDALSHVAVVESVDRDGTITMVHVGSNGVSRLRMNLRRPGEHAGDGGDVLNDHLRARSAKDPPGTRYLAGELWVGFASFYEADEAVAGRSTR